MKNLTIASKLRINTMKSILNTTFTFVFLAATISACQSEKITTESNSIKISESVHQSEITVYKSPTCGCCAEWVTYLEEEGFKVTAIDHDDVDTIKDKYGLPDPKLKSCHRYHGSQRTWHADDVSGHGKSHTERL